MTWRERAGWFWKNYGLVVILALGALHGLLYVFLVPPWQHPDEPTHFEYAWLIANRPGLPREGDYDQDMRRQVAASMLEHGFFKDLKWKPDLLSTEKPIDIGFSELRHPPAYYLLSSLPLRFLRSTDVTFQLYASRCISLLLFLLTLLVAWGVVVEIAPDDYTLRWMIPVTIALLPSFVDLMTAVNNDVGAITISSLCLWGCVYLVRRGFSFQGLLWSMATVGVGLWTKNTAYVLLPVVLLSLLFSLFRSPRQWVIGGVLVVGTAGGLLTVFSWGDAAFWYRNTFQPIPTRIATPQAPAGPYSIQLQVIPASPTPALYQILVPDQVERLRGKTVTLGVWMWATRSFRGRTPVLHMDGGLQVSKDIDLGTAPNFHAFSTAIPASVNRIWMSLEQQAEQADAGITTYYNGLVLAEGTRPQGESPEFDNSQGTQGVWGGMPFRNLLQNPSVESEWLSIRPWADTLGARSGLGQPSFIFSSLLDWQGAGWYYQATLQHLLETFWARFGWGHVPLLDPRLYSMLAPVTVLGLVGALPGFYRLCKIAQRYEVLVLGVAFVGVWSFAIVRGVAESLVGTVYIPGARYAYPAIIPTMLALGVGWRRILQDVGKTWHVPSQRLLALYLLLFLALDVFSFLTLANFYYAKG